MLRLTYLERGRLVKLPQAARKVQLARLDHDRATYIASLAEERTNLATVASDEALAQIERTLKQATLRHRQLTQRAKQLADGRLALEQALDRERLSLKEAHQKHLQIPIRRSVEPVFR